MKKLLIIVLPVWLITVSLHAQGEIDEQQKVFFRNERSLGILLNSDGFGLSYREGKRVDFLNKRFFEIELGNLKHSKEYRYTYNNYGGGSGSFVFGKLNAVYFLRGGLGRQHEIFKKADLGGVAVRYFYSAGPVLALYKPIYYRVLYQVSGSIYYFEIREEKFDVSIHDPTLIYSKASFFKGLDETKALPGLYAKTGFNFEYSRQDKIIHAIEMGAQINAFPKEIPIMAAPHNKAIFFSLFLSYRIGVIVDPLHPEEMNIRNLFRRNRQ
jgi:hypothetical protein